MSPIAPFIGVSLALVGLQLALRPRYVRTFALLQVAVLLTGAIAADRAWIGGAMAAIAALHVTALVHHERSVRHTPA